MRRDLRFFILAIATVSLPLLPSCHNKNNGLEKGEPAGSATGEVVVTREQFEGSGMKIGNPLPTMFQEKINATGYIAASPSGLVKISTIVPGRVKKIGISIGEKIKKGQLLLTLESNEIIVLQQEYAEAFHKLNALKSRYERQKALSEEQITAQKEFINAESEYRSLNSKAQGLKARLRMISIDPSHVENGTILPVASIHSPINGVVTKIDLVLGEFIEPQESVMELFDPAQLQLQIYVFEKDLKDLAVGQQVFCYDPGNLERVAEATLSHLGQSIDPESKTILCIARLNSSDRRGFVNNMYVKTEIISCQREALAIPSQALIIEEDNHYLLTLIGENDENLVFRKIPVQLGVVQQEYAELLDDGVKDVLIEGVYNLFIEE